MTRHTLFASLIGGLLLLLIYFSLESGLSSSLLLKRPALESSTARSNLPSPAVSDSLAARPLNTPYTASSRNTEAQPIAQPLAVPASLKTIADITLVPASAVKTSLVLPRDSVIQPDSRAAMGIATGFWRQRSTPGTLDQDLTSRILKGINFQPGSNKLTIDSHARLDEIVMILIDKQDMQIEIGGHTDSIGKPASNLALSQKRAEAVVRYVVDKGIQAERVSARGYGHTKPLADNDTEEGRHMNRRVELSIRKQLSYRH